MKTFKVTVNGQKPWSDTFTVEAIDEEDAKRIALHTNTINYVMVSNVTCSKAELFYDDGITEKNRNKYFTLTEDHIKLLKRSNVRWDSYLYDGAPVIDAKRPFGSSSGLSYIAEILDGFKINSDFGEEDEEEPMPRPYSEYVSLYHQVKTALQIVLVNGFFKTGTYVTSNLYSEDWTLVEDF